MYVGYTADLRKRLAEHNRGKNLSTKNRSWHCIYYEACVDNDDARRRERYFKTTAGRRALRLRLKSYLLKRR
ncbi:MAG: GIY-YIG nuclease family protein [Minisyncoccota bacterium]